MCHRGISRQPRDRNTSDPYLVTAMLPCPERGDKKTRIRCSPYPPSLSLPALPPFSTPPTVTLFLSCCPITFLRDVLSSLPFLLSPSLTYSCYPTSFLSLTLTICLFLSLLSNFFIPTTFTLSTYLSVVYLPFLS